MRMAMFERLKLHVRGLGTHLQDGWRLGKSWHGPAASVGIYFTCNEQSTKDNILFYLHDIYAAIKQHPAVIDCGTIRVSSWTEVDLVKKDSRCDSPRLPKVIMVMPQRISSTIASQQKTLDQIKFLFFRAKMMQLAVVFIADHIEWTKVLQQKLDAIKQSKRTLCAFTFSPHVQRITEYAATPFYWLPFAVDLNRFGMFTDVGYKYDFGFSGDCTPRDHPSRAVVCTHFSDMSQQGIKLTPNLLTPKNQDQMTFGYWKSATYHSMISRTKMWLCTMSFPTRSDTLTGFGEELEAISVRATEKFFPSGVDLISPRYFEVMASGTTLVLCDACTVCSGLFRDGVHVVMFNNYTHLLVRSAYTTTSDENTHEMSSSIKCVVAKFLYFHVVWYCLRSIRLTTTVTMRRSGWQLSMLLLLM